MNVPGWDYGSVYRTKVYPTAQDDQGFMEHRKRFTEFIRSFRIDREYVYREQLRRNLLIPKYFLEVELDHLISYDEALATQIKEYPSHYIPLFEEVVESVARQSGLISDKMSNFQVMILSGSNCVPIRALDVSMLSKLVKVSGIIVYASSITCKAKKLCVVCRSCRNVKFVNVPAGLDGVQISRKCEGSKDASGPKDCPLDPYVISHDKSKFVDQQTYKLQETPGSIPVGEFARHIVMSADRCMVNKVSPGTRVMITGIFSLYNPPGRSKSSCAAASIGTPYIYVVGIQADVDADSNSGGVFTEFEEEEYLAMASTKDIYERFIFSVAPYVYGGDDIKRAITCLLFGGSRKILPDGMKIRGDINVLLLGDPGTAKSQLLKFVEKVAPIAIYTSGKGSSAAGLTASVIRDPVTREFTLEGGAMVLADGGVVCIDEFDKMREEDRVAIHEAMEQQTISIAKAGIATVLNSRTSVLAAANPVFGRYDDMKTAGENVDFQSTILSRFDLIFIVKDVHDRLRDEKIARHVLQVHVNSGVISDKEMDIDLAKMKRYISFCKRRCSPRLTLESAEKLSNYFVEVRSKVRNMYETETRSKNVIPITVRQLEAIVRISEAIAKMSLNSLVTEDIVDEAIRLFNRSTMDAIESGITDGYDSRSKFSSDVMRTERIICNMIPLGNKQSVRILIDELIKKDFPRVVIDKAITILVMREVLQYVDRRMKLVRISI